MNQPTTPLPDRTETSFLATSAKVAQAIITRGTNANGAGWTRVEPVQGMTRATNAYFTDPATNRPLTS